LILDQTGEWTGRVDVETTTVPETVAAIKRLAPQGKWTIAAALDDDQLPALIRWLIPVPTLGESPVLALGGMVLLVDEVDLVAPQGPPSREIRTLYRRSRHVGLSVISATQRPGNVSREVSAQSQHLIAHFLSEPRDRDYIVDAMRWDRPQTQRWLEWVRRHPHGAVWKEVQTGRLLYLPESGPPRTQGAAGPQLSLDAPVSGASGKVASPVPAPKTSAPD
jgi:hypothetical protein